MSGPASADVIEMWIKEQDKRIDWFKANMTRNTVKFPMLIRHLQISQNALKEILKERKVLADYRNKQSEK